MLVFLSLGNVNGEVRDSDKVFEASNFSGKNVLNRVENLKFKYLSC